MEEDDEGNYSEMSDTEGDTASVMTEVASLHPHPSTTTVEHPDEGEQQQSRAEIGQEEVGGSSSNPVAQDGSVENNKGSKVMELLMLLQKG